MRDCESASQPHTAVRTKPPPALQAPTDGFNPLRADIRILQPPATRCTSSALLVTARILAYWCCITRRVRVSMWTNAQCAVPSSVVDSLTGLMG